MTYDPEANAAYIHLVQAGPGGVLFDFDGAGPMIGVAILGAWELLPVRFLDGAVLPGHPE